MTDQSSELASALNQLASCNQTMGAMREEIAELRSLLKLTNDMLNAAMSLQPIAPTAKNGRGRPRKVTDDRWLLDAFSNMKAAFIAANKSTKATDTAVTTWYFEQEFKRLGLRESRARSPAFQRKLKRLKNRLGDVRNHIGHKKSPAG